MTSTTYTVAEVEDPGHSPSLCSNCQWGGQAIYTGDIGGCCLPPGDPSPVGRCSDCDVLTYVDQPSAEVLLSRVALSVFDACKRAVSKNRSLDGLNLDAIIHSALRPAAEIGAGLAELVESLRCQGIELPAGILKPPAVRIVIGLDGGLIQGVTANAPVEFLVYDYDVEGCSEDEVVSRPGLDGGEVEVFDAGSYPAAVDPKIVAKIYASLDSEGDGND